MPVFGFKIPLWDDISDVELAGALSSGLTGLVSAIFYFKTVVAVPWLYLIAFVSGAVCALVGTNGAGAHAGSVPEALLMGGIEGFVLVYGGIYGLLARARRFFHLEIEGPLVVVCPVCGQHYVMQQGHFCQGPPVG